MILASNPSFPCDYCAIVYREEKSVTKCPECETSWCLSCSLDALCPECNKKDEPVSAEDAARLTDPGVSILDCPKCGKPILTWDDSFMDFTTGEKVTTISCIICGHVHETTTTPI